MSATPRKYGLALLAGILVLGFTGLSAAILTSCNRHYLETSTNADAVSIAKSMQHSLLACIRMQQNIQFLHDGTPDAGVALFSRYAASSLTTSECKGLASLSLARLLLPEQHDALPLTGQTSGSSGFTINPAGERALYAPVIDSVAAPGHRALRLGNDLLTNKVSQDILTRARDSGQPELSGPITLITQGGTEEPAFQIAVPIFRTNIQNDSTEGRRANIWGWSIATIAARAWILDALPKGSGGLYVSVQTPHTEHLASIGKPRATSAAEQAISHPVELGKQEWILKVIPGPDYIANHTWGNPFLIVLPGLILAIIVGFIIHASSQRYALVRYKNESLENALQESDERWRFALEGGDDGVWIWHAETGKTDFSPRCDTILGVPHGGAVSARMHPDDVAPEQAAMQSCLEGRTAIYQSEHRMRGEDGKWRWISARGMVLARNPEGRALRMIGIITDITERKTAAERLNTLGQNDVLTGLPNRTLFFSILQHAIQVAKRRKSLLALIYVDVDNLKTLNDNFGRMTADHLLQDLGKTLQACVRESDVVAHFGGDDFAILLPAISNAEDVQLVTSKIQQALAKDFVIRERHFSITVSMGVELFPLHSRSAESLINMSQRAVRIAKALGKNQVHIGTMPPPAA